MNRLVEVVASHCKADHWTADARTCVGAAVDHDAALQCAHKHMTEEQHELVVKDMRPLLPDMKSHDNPTGTQAEIAERLDKEGIALMEANNYTEATRKFMEAAARVLIAPPVFPTAASHRRLPDAPRETRSSPRARERRGG